MSNQQQQQTSKQQQPDASVIYLVLDDDREDRRLRAAILKEHGDVNPRRIQRRLCVSALHRDDKVVCVYRKPDPRCVDEKTGKPLPDEWPVHFTRPVKAADHFADYDGNYRINTDSFMRAVGPLAVPCTFSIKEEPREGVVVTLKYA